jgi:hypothetical protein
MVEILADEQAEQVVGAGVIVVVERIGVGAHRGADRARQGLFVTDRGDRGQAGLDRLQLARLDPGGIGIGGIIVGDPLFVAARCATGGRGPLDDRGIACFGAERDVEPDTDRGAVGGDLGSLAPGAIGVSVEIVAGLDRPVHQRLVDAREGTGLGDGRVEASRANESARRFMVFPGSDSVADRWSTPCPAPVKGPRRM